MLVVGFLPPALQTRLRSSLGGQDEFRCARSWSDLLDAGRAARADVLVMDPREIDASCTPAWGSTPLVVYTAATQAAIRAAIPYARAGAWDIILEGAHDSPRMLREALERAASAALIEQMLVRLQSQFERMPAAVAQALRDAMRRPTVTPSVQHLARSSGLSPLTLRRGTDRAELASPKTLLLAARVAWAYQQLRISAGTIKSVAERLRERPENLARQVRWMTGQSPGILRSMEPSCVIRELESRVLASAAICQAET